MDFAIISIHERPTDDVYRSDQYGSGFSAVGIDLISELKNYICDYAWSPIVWCGGRRLKANFLSSHFCTLDFDEGTTIDDALRIWGDHEHILGITRSHQTEKNGIICDRFRIALRFEEPVRNLDVYEHHMKMMVEIHKSDKKAKDGARYFFPCTDIISIRDVGEKLKVWPLPRHQQKIVLGPISPNKPTKAINMILDFGAFDKGSRNDLIYKVASDMTRQGKSVEEIVSFIDGRTDLDADEVKLTVLSAHNRYNSVTKKE